MSQTFRVDKMREGATEYETSRKPTIALLAASQPGLSVK